MKYNKELAKYVEKKTLKRLTIFAEFNKGGELSIRGEYIFGVDEKDRKSAATFLILLLDCIEKWA